MLDAVLCWIAAAAMVGLFLHNGSNDNWPAAVAFLGFGMGYVGLGWLYA